MTTVDQGSTWYEGCAAAVSFPDNTSGYLYWILDFGSPVIHTGTSVGQVLFNNQWVTATAVEYAADAWIDGWEYCRTDKYSATWTLIVGTTNLGSATNVSTFAGEQLGGAYAGVDSYALANTGQIYADGGIDIETGWAGAVPTLAFVNGYHQSAANTDLDDFGDLGGCPQSWSSGNPTCGAASKGWTFSTLWQAKWGTVSGNPSPEIYAQTGANARQWAALSLYSASAHGMQMYFHGSLTQWQACIDTNHGPGCAGAENTPDQGYTQLNNELYSHASTRDATNYLYNKADVTWQN